MKKIIPQIPLFVLLAMLLSACSNNDKGPFTLKMRLQKGDKFTQNINMDMTTSISMMGQTKDMKSNMLIGSDFEVLDSSAAGTEIKVTYTKMDMQMEGANLSDSLNDKLIGRSVFIRLKDHQVVEVDQRLDSIKTNDSTVNAMLGEMFSQENMNNMYGMLFNIYPQKPVNIGDSWNTTNTIDLSGMTMKIDSKYKLTGVNDGIAEIDLSADINSKGQMSEAGMDFNLDLKGVQKGKFYVTISNGYIQKGNYNMNVKTEMDVQGQKIPMTIKADYTVNQ